MYNQVFQSLYAASDLIPFIELWFSFLFTHWLIHSISIFGSFLIELAKFLSHSILKYYKDVLDLSALSQEFLLLEHLHAHLCPIVELAD